MPKKKNVPKNNHAVLLGTLITRYHPVFSTKSTLNSNLSLKLEAWITAATP
ncbi:hypothetical protein [Limosilactobacillus albertensis]|uniref:hypothetical protein n=1 Tax=Limosilactobacillus albertensis TaxID=2759752 RepID=UPI001E60DCA1|nr:hypothetical protein [Limosilactobacillus albertensis]